MQQVAPVQERFNCHEAQQQVASICVTGTRSPGHSSGCTQSAMGGSGHIRLATSSHIGQSGGEVAGLPVQGNNSDSPGWPNMPWFWDLVAMSIPIPLSLPNLSKQLPMQKNNSNCTEHSNWPNMPWFWDLVTMSSQIPLSLPNLPNLFTQPFNQIPHRNLISLNLHRASAIKEHGYSGAVAARIEAP